MAISVFLILFAVGALLAFAVASGCSGGSKWVVLALTVLLLAAGIGAGIAVERVSPQTFAKFPLQGATIAQGAAWLAFLSAGGALGAALRIALGLLSRSGKKKPTPAPEPSAE